MNETGAVIKCGVLPTRDSGISLIQDFCEKADLILLDEIKDQTRQVFNVSFNQYIVEAIDNAVAFGLEVPKPHERNNVLELLSTEMDKTEKNSSVFLSHLKSYIDTYFFSSNKQLCHQYGFSESYFSPSAQFSKQEIVDIIKNESQQRALDKSRAISNYRTLAAKMIELCLKLTKDS